MGSRLLADVSRSLGGLDPTWIANFSTRFETARKGKDGRPIVQWRNPLIPGVGRLFRPGGTQDLSEIAHLLVDNGYLAPGSVEANYKDAGESAKAMITAALNREHTPTMDELHAERVAAADERAREVLTEER